MSVWLVTANLPRPFTYLDYRFCPSIFIRQFVHSDENKDALLEFIQELDEQKARQLAQLDKYTIKEAFMLAGAELADVVCYDLGETGLALGSPPYTSIWRAFQFVAKLL
jgi:hypothetical protein